METKNVEALFPDSIFKIMVSLVITTLIASAINSFIEFIKSVSLNYIKVKLLSDDAMKKYGEYINHLLSCVLLFVFALVLYFIIDFNNIINDTNQEFYWIILTIFFILIIAVIIFFIIYCFTYYKGLKNYETILEKVISNNKHSI